MRLRLDCAIATTLPTVLVTTATTHSSADQSGCDPRSATTSRRSIAANAAAFEPVAMTAVTLVGAPRYTSGAHEWKGTEEILKLKPTRMSARPKRKTGSRERPGTAAAMRSKLVAPVAP